MTLSKEFIREQKEKLVSEKESLKKSIGEIAKEEPGAEGHYEMDRPDYGRSDEENADEEERYLAESEVGNSIENHLREIDAALEKIEKGTYGVCTECGREIEEERLKAFPAAATCADH